MSCELIEAVKRPAKSVGGIKRVKEVAKFTSITVENVQKVVETRQLEYYGSYLQSADDLNCRQ